MRIDKRRSKKLQDQDAYVQLTLADDELFLVHLTLSKKAPTRSPVTNGNSTPKRFFKRLFPPPSPAKCIVARQHVSVKRNEAAWVWIRALILQEFKKSSEPTLQMKLQPR
ncbi:unnamed protein product [Brassica rapa subsp. trilocularis]